MIFRDFLARHLVHHPHEADGVEKMEQGNGRQIEKHTASDILWSVSP
jgi:hypothetical protein